MSGGWSGLGVGCGDYSTRRRLRRDLACRPLGSTLHPLYYFWDQTFHVQPVCAWERQPQTQSQGPASQLTPVVWAADLHLLLRCAVRERGTADTGKRRLAVQATLYLPIQVGQSFESGLG